MLAFGVAAKVQPESIVKALSYTGELSSKASSAGFDLVGIIQSSSVFLIVLGAIVGLVGLFGCIGACCSVKWMLSVYLIVLVVILLAEIALIIFGALYPEKFKSETQPIMQKSLIDQFENDVTFANGTIMFPKDEVSLAWTSMQFELGCCGAFGPEDYKKVNFTRISLYPTATVPVSCCAMKDGPVVNPTSSDFVDINSCQSQTPSDSSINRQDCYVSVENVVKGFGRIAIGIAAAIVAVELILIMLALWVCRSIGTDRSKGV